MKTIKLALSVMLILVFGYIIIGEFAFPYNTPRDGFLCKELPGDKWTQVMEDGTRVPYQVPGRAEGVITLETTLPETLDREACAMCFRGMDMRIFVDGKLRMEQKTEDYALLGDRSAEVFVMAPLFPEDAGKNLTVEYEYNSGFVYEVYYGTRLGIWARFFSMYGAELFVGILILSLGAICYIASTVYRLVYRKYLEMQHLSIGVLLGGCWVMSNSIFRQFYTRNVSVMSDIPFLMVILMPLPFLIFIDSLQKGRYTRILTVMGGVEIADFVILMAMFISGRVVLVRSFIAAASCALACIIVIAWTIIRDVRMGFVRDYCFIAIGFLVLAVAAVAQIMTYLFAHNGVFSGLMMAVGLLGFLICATIHTIKQLIGIRLTANEAMHATKAKDQFLANMSHEIRTPLNGILGMDEMIIRDAKDSHIRKYALDIRSAGNTLLSLINDILDLSKIEAGSFEIIPVRYSLASVLNDVINMTRHKALKKDLEYLFEVSPDIPCDLYGDEIRVRQVLINIINNAVKYTEKGSVRISVSAGEMTGRRVGDDILLRIQVTDTGIGIRKEDMEKLFSSFQRLDEKKNRNIEGTGLGLHITQRLIDLMNGEIRVESRYGEGSTFTVTLPQRIEDASPIGDFSQAVSRYIGNMEIEEATLYAPDAKVLVVDDNEMNLGVMEGLLRDTKIQLTLALSGEECIEQAGRERFDCILLDQMMPGLNGEETLLRLKDQDILKGTPVIALTADAIMGARESYIAKGFTDYLSKPVKYDRLEDALRRYLPAEKQGARPAPAEDLPVLLIWGTDADRLRREKERLSDIYRCVCVTGSRAKDKYLEKHTPDAVMQV